MERLAQYLADEDEETQITADVVLITLILLVFFSILFEWATDALKERVEEYMEEVLPVLKCVV
eukprot:SAG22_NODE_10616_length_525_cov_0.762911_2_plen_63_part_01